MTDDQTPSGAVGGGCPVAHGADVTRLYGPEAATDPHDIYARLRKEHGSVAPVLLEGDVPAWLVLGYRENRRVLDNPSSSAGIHGSGGTSGTAVWRRRPR